MHAINVSFFSTLCTPYYDNQYNPISTFSSTNIKDAILHPNQFNFLYNSSSELWNKGNVLTTKIIIRFIKQYIHRPQVVMLSQNLRRFQVLQFLVAMNIQ